MVATVLAVVLAVILTPVGSADRADAHNNLYGWWGCTQRDRTLYDNVYIGAQAPGQPFRFPAPGMGDGVVNSFADRFADAVAGWNSQVLGAAGQPYGVVWVADTALPVSVRFRYIAKDPGVLGEVHVPIDCRTNIHSTIRYALPVNITGDIAVRSDWFTQDNSRRALWEGCDDIGGPAYTCSKLYDAGSTIMHEIGHALGLPHPSQVDSHIGSGTGSRTLANCFSVNNTATMCQISDYPGPAADTYYRSHKRTLEAWDITSLTLAFP